MSQKEAYFLFKELYPKLNAFENERKIILKKFSILALISIALYLIFLSMIEFEKLEPYLYSAFFLIAACYFLASVLWFTPYKKKFKSRIVRAVIENFNESFQYHPQRGIGELEYMRSKLFLRNPDRYSSEDYVEGIIDKTKFRFSEIHSHYRSRDSKGRSTYHTIFRGLYFIADFNKDFHGNTIVLPDLAESRFGSIGSFLQKSLSKVDGQEGELVSLEDLAFEKEFKVLSTDPIEARYILSPSLMNRILEFRQKMKHNVHISFAQSEMHIAISLNRNLFEPKFFKTLNDPKIIEEYLQDIQFFTNIIEEMNLNTRIWTKA